MNASRAVCLVVALAAFNAFPHSLRGNPQAKTKQTKHMIASGDHPLWLVDLHTLGYPEKSSQLQLRRGLDKFDTVDFVSETVVVATFLTRETVPDLQRRDDPNRSRPYKLHAVFLDSATGKIVKTLEWPLDNPVAGIFPSFDGSFLFFSTDRIVLYSSDWTKVKELPLPQLQGSPDLVRGISQSPSGKSLVVQFRRGAATLCLRIQADNLDSSESPCEILELFTASDDGVVAPSSLPEGSMSENGATGPVVQYDGSMTGDSSDAHGRIQNPEVKDSARTLCISCVGMPQFVNNDTIVVYSPLHLSVTGKNGDPKFTQDLNPKEEWIDEFGRPVRASANGRRFVVAFNTSLLRAGATIGVRMSTGDMPAAFPGRIDAYDLPAVQPIYTLAIKDTAVYQIWGLALSPGGEKLAVDSGGFILLYKLPPNPQSASTPH
jgi:hypothetical protein